MAEYDGEPSPHLPERVEDELTSLHARGELPDTAHVDAWCAEHPAAAARIRRTVESLRSLSASDHPESIGPWRVLGVLGQGGMGTVYRVERTSPVRMQAALKLIKLGMDSRAVVARFEQERQALARMQHDGIAKVYDCGTSGRGQPYFVMELVEGRPLTAFCEAHGFDVAQKLHLVQQVCNAIQHAHNKGVVHRDLKPSNVLVSGDPDAPRIKIIDFGLAKALGEKLVEATLFTEAGQTIGTPEYMAPEQADPQNADVDTRADVYSLGVILYELLVGELPFPTDELRRATPSAMQRILLEKDPPRPSARLRSNAGRTRERAALLRALRSDLDWVVLKALEKDRERRYETPDALAEDLRRFLEHEPLVAGPPSAAYRLKKTLQRHRLQFTAAFLVLATALVGAAFAIDYAFEAKEHEQLAESRAKDNEALAARESQAKELAMREKVRADEKVRDFDLLSAVLRHDRAVEEKARLYPATPDKLPAIQRWLAGETEQLLAMRPAIQATVDKLTGQDADPADRSSSTKFLAETLASLLPKLDMLASKEKPQVEQLLRWAQFLRETARQDHPGAATTWEQCRVAVAAADDVVASARYHGVSIDFANDAFLGLVPLGVNPVTKLLEFYDLRSAWDGAIDPSTIPIPRIAADGSIRVGPETGIVFVLLPGGHVELGAQNKDPNAPRYEKTQAALNWPMRARLDPFLVARHELTRAQWQRMWTWDDTEAQPTFFRGDGKAAGKGMHPNNPVDNVSWHMADLLARRHGMSLPTTAQWEYSCRGGTDTPWWCGTSPKDLEGKANLCDKTGARLFRHWGAPTPFDDAYVFHAEVGTFAPNPFGLYDVHGNVWEWCLETWEGQTQVRDGDGLRFGGPDRGVADQCGGAFESAADHARSAFSIHQKKDTRSGDMGLRVVRLLHPR